MFQDATTPEISEKKGQITETIDLSVFQFIETYGGDTFILLDDK